MPADSSATDRGSEQQQERWTVMIYMIADDPAGGECWISRRTGRWTRSSLRPRRGQADQEKPERRDTGRLQESAGCMASYHREGCVGPARERRAPIRRRSTDSSTGSPGCARPRHYLLMFWGTAEARSGCLPIVRSAARWQVRLLRTIPGRTSPRR